MKVLIIALARNNQINPNLANVLTAAHKISSVCDVLVLGAADLSKVTSYSGITSIYHAANLTSNDLLASNLTESLANIAKGYTHVLMASDSAGKDLLPRVAGFLDMGQISDVLAISSPNIFKKPMYAGNIIAEVESFDEIKFLTIRTICFDAVASSGNAAVVNKELLVDTDNKIQFVSEKLSVIETVGLASAKRIVSGGRSLGSKESFDEVIGGFAVKIGAAIGASKAAVEAGYANNDCQVGQTGKIVAPELYIAVGVSGAVQHIAGMKDSKKVLAINNDPNAQIFEYADYGYVGDLFEVIPEIMRGL